MAQTGFFHHIGSFLLLVATVLLIVTCISAPVVHDIGLMRVETSSNGAVVFGTFGWCILGGSGNGDNCSPSEVGYSIAQVMNSVDGTQFSSAASTTTRALTKAMILHPIACGLNFIAFLLALGAGVVGSLLASMVALLAFLLTVVILIIDFVLFSIVKSNVNDNDSNANPHYSTAAWTILVAGICSLLGTIILFFTCCSGRMHRRRQARAVDKTEAGYAGTTAAPRRRRWF